MRIPKICKSVREFFWPLLEPPKKEKISTIKMEDFIKCNNDLDIAMTCIQEYEKHEDDRRKEVEGKAIIFIGTFAVAVTVLINLTKDFISSKQDASLVKLVIVLFIAMTIVYLCRAIVFSIKATQRRNYQSFGFPKFMLQDSSDKMKQIIVEKYNAIEKNKREINIKVDYMTMAQEYFKRAVWCVILLTIIFVGSYLVTQRVLMIPVCISSIVKSHYIVIVVLLSILLLIFMFKTYKLKKRLGEMLLENMKNDNKTC